MNGPSDAHVAACAAVAAHTAPECARCPGMEGKGPGSCCTAAYCRATIEYAQRAYEIELVTTENTELPLMGPTGCTAAPHLRPWCAIFACALVPVGVRGPSPKWVRVARQLGDAAVRSTPLGPHLIQEELMVRMAQDEDLADGRG